MLGLQYILDLYQVQQSDLANELGIKRQNITIWLSGKQDISKKHLPALSQKFNIPEEYFQKELTEDDIRKINELKYNRPITGLEYLLQIRNVSISDLAKELNITRANFYNWLKGARNMPDKYIKLLSERFCIPRELILKELTIQDKIILLECEKIRLSKEIY